MEQQRYLEELSKIKQFIIPWISHEIVNLLIETKQRLEQQQEDQFPVALVHLSWDLTHASHVQYIQTIIEKLRRTYWYPHKLLVWVEADLCTMERKWKENIYNERERKYIFEHIKGVDRAYIEFEHPTLEQNNDARPAHIVRYLSPDVLVSHEEHIPPSDQEKVRQRCKEYLMDLLVIQEWDEMEYLRQHPIREKHNRSTTNTVKQVLKKYKDHPRYVS